ncbi:MAG: DNA polymerase III subunit epsilon [Sphingomonadaceae bacterium]
MREIVLDTETTGLDPREGHRMVELAALELVERVPTGRTLHLYFNPERTMPPEAERVHGLTDAFLADKPRFAERLDEVAAFLADSPLVAHNAIFDWRFLNLELETAGAPPLPFERMIDTMELARRRLPGARHSLDALCQRFGIDLSRRMRHGALIDTELLAAVYVELTGGRQMGLDLATAAAVEEGRPRERPARSPRHFAVPADELERHRAFVAAMQEPIWLRAGAGRAGA